MPRIHLLGKAVLLTLLGLGGACVRQAPVTVEPTPTVADTPRYAGRLVLALDGIDYRDILAAREHGLFAEFRPPSRLISTFPSISDIAWHEIFDVLPPRGYQRIYFSRAANAMVGGPLDAIRPIEFEERMDMGFGSKWHHLSAYLASNKVARREIATVVRDFFNIRGRTTVYAYNVGPDALQHTRGNLDDYLHYLDAQLLELQRQYHRHTGQSLNIVVVSDHGHNHFSNAQFLPVAKDLKTLGFQPGNQLDNANDVAFSVDGVTTGFGVFVTADSVPAVAHALAGMQGVEVVTYRADANDFWILAHGDSALLQYRRDTLGIDMYRYQIVAGDPLEFTPILARMRADSALDRDGYADATSWLRYTADHKFPAALERIVHGHTDVTLNPAPILVSVQTGYQVGLGMVSVANKLRPLGGTHGALDANNSQGVVMTNFQTTHDDVTTRVRNQFGAFADFGDVQGAVSGAKITTATLLARDHRGRRYGHVSAEGPDDDALYVEIRITDAQRQWIGDGGGFQFNVTQTGQDGDGDQAVATINMPLPVGTRDSVETDVTGAGDGMHFLVPVTAVLQAPLLPSSRYTVQIVLGRKPATVSPTQWLNVSFTKVIATLVVRTNADGRIWPY